MINTNRNILFLHNVFYFIVRDKCSKVGFTDISTIKTFFFLQTITVLNVGYRTRRCCWVMKLFTGEIIRRQQWIVRLNDKNRIFIFPNYFYRRLYFPNYFVGIGSLYIKIVEKSLLTSVNDKILVGLDANKPISVLCNCNISITRNLTFENSEKKEN